MRQKYEMFDVNVYQENIFHTKMHVKEFDLETYLFEAHAEDLSFKDRQRIELLLKREIEELFHGRNLTSSFRVSGRRSSPGQASVAIILNRARGAAGASGTVFGG